ncbi:MULTISPECIES: tyrosine-type recombinase/integrase [unclassified Bradyrhizobium]|uniref:tyrosine-type recombinase/integrase n=1 Tax=unclassified Bradyrhizobium TaxID=2631580 RepID=UPI0028E7F3E6|nr:MULTISPECIES: tyrosine-type recombinase/integrase [unclassified Bradyrhizobium]
MPKLTTDFIEAVGANGKDQTFSDTKVAGLILRVTPAGTKLFRVEARVGGKLRRSTLGTFPQMSLSAAQREARPALDALRQGRDPALEKAARQKAIEDGAITVEKLATQWIENRRSKLKPRTLDDYQKLFEQHINPAVGQLPVQVLAFADVEALHAKMARTPRRANYSVSTLRALLNYAELMKIRPPHSNPCKGIEFYRERQRERFLSEAEIAKAGSAIETAEGQGVIGPHAAAGLRLALFTGARSGEIIAAQWSHVVWSRRIIRLPDSKNNEARTIHLSDAAVEVLRSIPRIEPYIIAGAKAGEPYKNLSRAWIIARAYGGLDDVRLHDLRHSYASLAAGRGVSLQTIGALLGHRAIASTKRYAHLARDIVASVNDDLGAVMQAALSKKPALEADNVVKFKRSRKRPVPQ